jgi:hypothetical protein
MVANTFTLHSDEAICHCCQQMVKKETVIKCDVCGHTVCKDKDCLTLDDLSTGANVCTDCLLNTEKMMYFYASQLRKEQEISAAKSILIEKYRLAASDAIIGAAVKMAGDIQ